MGLDVSVFDCYGVEVFSDRLGNVGFIDRIHKVISQYPDLFPLICQKVSYSGTHCCDEIRTDDVQILMDEVDLLVKYPIDASDRDKESIAQFTATLRHACLVAIRYKSPILF